MLIIGITGRKRVGKDTLAAALTYAHGISTKDDPAHATVTMSFADPLRDMLYALNPIVANGTGSPYRLASVVDAYGWEGLKDTRFAAEVRALLQRMGTDAVRAQDPDFWTRRMRERILATPDPDDAKMIVIPDVRFANEIATVHSLGGVVIQVRNPRVEAAATDTHASEDTDHLPSDLVFLNDGTLDRVTIKAVGLYYQSRGIISARRISPRQGA